ncbi:MAG: glycyl-radical enzyme activating protein [bacterium]|nr:glycyl-radical enzyme activating protein [bacterium]
MTVDSATPLSGWIFDIKKFALHDGPGIRTTVFCKGCPLRCLWCHNPESLELTAELSLSGDKCIGCGGCVEACPSEALRIDDSGTCQCQRDLCQRCGKCVDKCFSGALEMIGQEVSVDDVMDQVGKDATFYRVSGGGVTISGGEPLAQSEFVTDILRQCQAEGFHTALDTCGCAPWETLRTAAEYADLVLYDLKLIDSDAHKQYTGATNDLILENLRRLCRDDLPVEIRIPIIPSLNDSDESIDAAGEFISTLENVPPVRLLAYHRFAAAKYARLDRENSHPHIESPDAASLNQIAERLSAFDLTVLAG